ncbi:unnamed protein product [Cuscuta epithymum]|uniref:Jacalin-type lectin domain-containing protein n=1 Tax=Cuscuta epithymum TaxID=186058 RepID=A0AAV0C3G0_9ASTE|nr:unnamed protein product [Cuscuta epithymum]
MAARTDTKKKITEIGPRGGPGGRAWDDGNSYDGIREITVAHGHCIDSITVVYDKHGKASPAEKHGEDGAIGVPKPHVTTVKLQYPEEYLISVMGYYGQHHGSVVIRALTFTSNRTTYGPFGMEEGEPFSLSVKGGTRIIGFKGKSGWYVDSITCYVAHLPPPKSCNAFQTFHKSLKKLAGTLRGEGDDHPIRKRNLASPKY